MDLLYWDTRAFLFILDGIYEDTLSCRAKIVYIEEMLNNRLLDHTFVE
ncbi:hypothetical protein [Rickettsiella massiliensis]|nr:hypothetical protein [Rickettsiella massiliensis]